MNTYFVTLANGSETVVVADTVSAAMTYARRSTASTPVAARRVS
jgi:hypothetical protein